jgi:hypothetical protein
LWSRVRVRIAHAFALRAESGEFEERDRNLLDRIARGIANRGLASPAIFLVESLAPLSFLGSQLVHALTPVLETVASPRDVEQLARLLERREVPGLLAARLRLFDDARLNEARRGRRIGPRQAQDGGEEEPKR